MNTNMHCKCGALLPLEVLHTSAGFYLGYFCPKCGPYDRVSDYFTARPDKTLAAVKAALTLPQVREQYSW